MKTALLAFLISLSTSVYAQGTSCDSVKSALDIGPIAPYKNAAQLILEDKETLERVEIHIAQIADFVMDIPHAIQTTQYAITEVNSYSEGPLLKAIDKMATLSIFRFLDDPDEKSCLFSFNLRRKTNRNSIFKRIKNLKKDSISLYSTIESEMDQEIVVRRAY